MARPIKAPAWVLITALSASACEVARVSNRPTEPTPVVTVPAETSSSPLVGTWAAAAAGSAADSPAPLSNCSNFQLKITSQSGNTGSGTFSTICNAMYQVNGTAQGTLNGSVLQLTLNATTQIPNVGACPITVTSNATLAGDVITLPFTANTCLGTFTGTETLRKSALFP